MASASVVMCDHNISPSRVHAQVFGSVTNTLIFLQVGCYGADCHHLLLTQYSTGTWLGNHIRNTSIAGNSRIILLIGLIIKILS